MLYKIKDMPPLALAIRRGVVAFEANNGKNLCYMLCMFSSELYMM